MKIKNYYSPNFNEKKRRSSSIKMIVIHYTGMQSERESLVRLCNPRFKVSSHFLINVNGNVYRLVKDKKVAWHAGVSCWGKYKNLNKNSIGIELVNKGHKVILQKNAGLESNFSDKEYLKSGATIYESSDDIYNNSDMILKVKEPIFLSLITFLFLSLIIF